MPKNDYDTISFRGQKEGLNQNFRRAFPPLSYASSSPAPGDLNLHKEQVVESFLLLRLTFKPDKR